MHSKLRNFRREELPDPSNPNSLHYHQHADDAADDRPEQPMLTPVMAPSRSAGAEFSLLDGFFRSAQIVLSHPEFTLRYPRKSS